MPFEIAGRVHAAPKGYRHATHRTRSPDDTLAAYAPLRSVFGITRLANVTGLDRIGLPVWMAVRPNSRSLSVSQGKGFDSASAKASALMESIELWHAENIELPVRHESYFALRKHVNVIDVTQLPRTPFTLRLEAPMDWIEGWDLVRGCSTWVPLLSVSTNHVRDPSTTRALLQSSNGLASGNHLLEAIVHALCEVIERDAGAVAMARRHHLERRVDLATVTNPLARRVLELLRGAEVEVTVTETTSDTGVPAYECTVFDNPEVPRWALKGFTGGSGAHLSADVAILRALTEAVQSRLTMIAGSRDDLFPSKYDLVDPAVLRAEHARLTETPATLAFTPRDLSRDSFEDDLGVLLESLARVGIDSVVVVELTRPALGIPVVKVVVPGLEGITEAAGYVPGPRAQRIAQETS